MTEITVNNVIRRDTLVWLLICQVMVLLPFIESHPLWLMALLLGCLGWRGWALHRGYLKANAIAKYCVVILALVVLYTSGYRQYNIDTMVAVVVLGFVLKTIETWGRRDALMLVFTGYFLTASHFIYSQTPWQAMYSLLTVVALTACAVSVHQSAPSVARRGLLRPLRTAAAMIAMSAPLAVILFFVVPRIPPLWAIPQQSRATTGISDEVTPGDIASLVKSPKEAFRVNFIGARPPREEWYWRALVFEQFDGKTWRLGDALPATPIPSTLRDLADYRYQVVMEVSGQRWVPTLDTAVAIPVGKAGFAHARTVQADVPINSVTGFEVVSYSRLPAHYIPGWRQREKALQLPSAGNERLRAWSARQRQLAGSDGAFVDRVLQHIRQNDYYYTLEPPRLLRASTQDEFWFDSRQGFCSHYASAFVFIMRSAGIPARMVGGYLGGRYNAEENFITVRQMDAHAWAEVWLQERGWVRVDPTSAVEPERIRQDLSDVFADTPSFVAALAGRTSSFGPLKNLQLWLDNFEYQWQRWVVQFDETSRMGFINELIGNKHLLVQLSILALVFALIPLLWVLMLGRNRESHKRSDAVRCVVRLEKQLAKSGLRRLSGESVAVFLQRAKEVLPSQRARLASIAKVFNQLEYAHQDSESRKRLLTRLRRLTEAF